MRLGLGSAQFGLDYGISNAIGPTPVNEVARVLSVAARHGATLIDTAPAYGDAQRVLGSLLAEWPGFDVVTKTPAFPSRPILRRDADGLEAALRHSLLELRLPKVYGLLVHAADDLLAEGGGLLFDGMRRSRDSGLVEKIGASVYTSAQIDALLERYELDIVQVPVNVFDQRLLRSGHLQRLHDAGIEIHARSVLLQGLMLMEPAEMAPYFDPFRQTILEFRSALVDARLTPLRAAVGFVAGLDCVDAMIVGVNDAAQLEEIAAAMEPLPATSFARFAVEDPALVDPSMWGA